VGGWVVEGEGDGGGVWGSIGTKLSGRQAGITKLSRKQAGIAN
jgi:hypothetical protein